MNLTISTSVNSVLPTPIFCSIGTKVLKLNFHLVIVKTIKNFIDFTQDKKKQIDNTYNNVDSNNFPSKFINLDEDLTLRTTTTDQYIHLDLFVVQPQTIIERISQKDKTRDDRKKN